jgi:hypothetical protein
MKPAARRAGLYGAKQMKLLNFAGIIVLGLTVVCGTATAETIEDRCLAVWKNNASYRRCINEATANETAPLKEAACSASSCVYRLTCLDRKDTTCTGSGYQIDYKQDKGGGYDIAVRDPTGQVTLFGQYGTTAMEYISGHLKNAKLRWANKDLILEVPK